MNRRQLLRLGALAAAAPKVALAAGPERWGPSGKWVVSTMPVTPSGRLALLEDWLYLGIISPAVACRLQDVPPLEAA
jgi:hypothetical protein